jgi:tetratricopeptide (TPR) repeat protein
MPSLQPRQKDFFISYSEADRKWAIWIAWCLENEGYTCVLQKWDFRPGSNFILEMDTAARSARRTIAVLSPNYLNSLYTQPEWAAAFVRDPTSTDSLLLPVRVASCKPQGMLSAIGYIDLVGSDEREALGKLLQGVRSTRAKPTSPPPFPGSSLSAQQPASLSLPQPDYPGTWPTVWHVPYRRNLYFTGREELLNFLYDRFTRKNRDSFFPQIQALSGLGGIGKTQTALEYAYRYGEKYRFVLWVNASTHESLLAEFMTLATSLNIPGIDFRDQNVVVTAIKRWLALQQNWLLILDGADDLTVILDFLPSNSSGNGHILLTTRATTLGTIASIVEVDKMGMEEGMLLLLRRARLLAAEEPLSHTQQKDLADAEAIVLAVDGLPLALDQAGAYIEETMRSLAHYLALYRTHSKELLRWRGHFAIGHPESVATTWSLAFMQVEQANRAAAALLQLCTFLAPDAIPEEIITEGGKDLGNILGPVAVDAFKLNEAIEVLGKYSLVRRNVETRTLSIHRLVQLVLRDSMNKKTQRLWTKRAIRAVNKVFPQVKGTTWSIGQRYLPHAQVCELLIEQEGFVFLEAAQLLYRTGCYLHEHTEYQQAEPIYQRALAIYEEVLGPIHLDTATCLNAFASLHHTQGNYDLAESLYRRVLAIREQVLGLSHLDTAASLAGLASLYSTEGKYFLAEPLYQKALMVYEQVGGPQHSDTANTLSSLGSLYIVAGKYSLAEPFCQQSLEIREQVSGSRHLDTAISCTNRAWLYYAEGKYDEAEPLYLRALSIYEQVAGPMHLDTTATLTHLALLYSLQEKYDAARSFYERSQIIYEQILSSVSSNTTLNFNISTQRGLDPGLHYLNRVASLNNLALLLQKKEGTTTSRPFFDLLLKLLAYPPASQYREAFDQKTAIHRVQDWLRDILRDMDTSYTSRSKLARTSALNRAISKLSNSPQQLVDSFSQAGQLTIKLITDRWRDVVSYEAGQAGNITILEYIRSPYIFTPPIKSEYLIGRDDVFERITSLWARPGQRNSLLIHGHRRMGKTSIAQAVKSRCHFGDTTESAYLSLEGQTLRHEGDFYQLLASRIWICFKDKLDKPDARDFTGKNARNNFDFFLMLLDSFIENRTLVIILDEFEMLYRRLGIALAEDIIAFLRGQTVTHAWMALALVGLSDLDDMSLSYNSSLLGWESIRVSFLDEEQVTNVLANPPQDPNFPLAYTPEALQTIATITYGQPYLVQVIGDRLVQRYNRIMFVEHKEHTGTFDIEDVEAVLKDPGFYSTASAYFEGVWGQAERGLSGEVTLLKELAQHIDGLAINTLQSILQLDPGTFTASFEALERHDVLRREDNRVRFAVPLMSRWIQDTRLYDKLKNENQRR